MSLYKDPILNLLFDNIDANDGGAIKTYHYGDPLFVPKSELPVLIGQVDTTLVSDLNNAEDQQRINYVLTVIADIRDFFRDTDNDSENIHYGYQLLQKIMEERDLTTLEYKSTSIVDIIRSNAQLSANAHIDTQSVSVINYGFTQGVRGEKSWAWEADISFTVYFSQIR